MEDPTTIKTIIQPPSTITTETTTVVTQVVPKYNFFKDLLSRFGSPTPIFWRIIRIIFGVLGSVSAILNTNSVVHDNVNPVLLQIFAYSFLSIAAISSLAKKNPHDPY